MKRAVTIFSLLLLLAFQSSAQEKAVRINELMNAFYANGNFSGAVYITEEGKPIFQKGYGFSNLEKKTPIVGSTRFLIASISKQYTAVLIMKLAEQGKLKLDDPLSLYFKEYPEQWASKVTLHQMLTNTSGIPDFFEDPEYQKIMNTPHTFNDLVNLIKNKPLLFAPGTKFEWSNMAWAILGKVVEAASEMTYEDYFRKTILAPLNLKNTSFVDKEKTIGEVAAQGYIYNFGDYTPAPDYYFHSQLAADGIITTPEDMTLFINALMKGKILSEDYLKLMLTPYTDSDNKNRKYGYGWYLGNVTLPDGRQAPVRHLPGGMRGYQAIFISMDDKYSVSIIANYSNAPVNQMINSLASLLLFKKYELPARPEGPRLEDIYKKEGMGSMMTALAALLNERKITEAEMNILAYEFLNGGKVDESLVIFKFIAEKFPESWNAHDSLGEAYARKGEKENAILSYEKSVKLNPDNSNGIDVLKKLKGAN